jgi:hypothetical protein
MVYADYAEFTQSSRRVHAGLRMVYAEFMHVLRMDYSEFMHVYAEFTKGSLRFSLCKAYA